MYLKVRAHPGSKKESVKVRANNVLEIQVKAPAAANTRIRELVAGHYAVPVSAVRIISGHRHRSKMLCVGGE